MRLRCDTGTLPGRKPRSWTLPLRSSSRSLTRVSRSAAGTTTRYSRFNPAAAVSVTCIGTTLHGPSLHGPSLHGPSLHGPSLHGPVFTAQEAGPRSCLIPASLKEIRPVG